MRSVFAALVLLNIAYFAWMQYQQKQDAAAESAVATPSALADPSERYVPKLVLVEEMRRGEWRANRRSVDGQPQACWFVGGLPEVQRSQIMDVKERMAALGIVATLRKMQYQVPSYIVYMGPMADRQQAYMGLQALLAKGIDAYVFEGGSLENGISLGVFQQAAGAESRARDSEKLAIELGTELSVRRQYRKQFSLWLRLTVDEHQKIAESTWADFSKRWPKLLRQKNLCNSIALSNEVE